MMLDLVGVWRLVDLYALAETGERTQLIGAGLSGYAVFEPGGRMMAIVTASNRATGRSVPELAELFLSMGAYSGKWSVDAEKFITVVDLAWDPSWVGTSQIRYYTFDGRTLSLRTAPIELPAFPGRKAIAYADWEREG
jgi:lipocalin-like protein